MVRFRINSTYRSNHWCKTRFDFLLTRINIFSFAVTHSTHSLSQFWCDFSLSSTTSSFVSFGSFQCSCSRKSLSDSCRMNHSHWKIPLMILVNLSIINKPIKVLCHFSNMQPILFSIDSVWRWDEKCLFRWINQ